MVVGSLTFHHFGYGRQGLVLVYRLASHWLTSIGLGNGAKGLDAKGEAGCSKCQASTRCQGIILEYLFDASAVSIRQPKKVSTCY